VVPSDDRRELLQRAHERSGHLGVAKTYRRLRERYYWPGMLASIVQHVASCDRCQRTRPAPPPRTELESMHVRDVWQLMAIDYVGPLPETADGNKYVLVVVDYASRWGEAFALKDQTAATTARCLVDNIFLRYGPPEEILSDQGANFLSELVTDVASFCGVARCKTTPYHPSSNGLVERLNKSLVDTLRKLVEKPDRTDWDQKLPRALWAYNSAVQAAPSRR
jgi:transposase InsO family protein